METKRNMTLDTAETMRIIMNEPIAHRAHGRSGFAGGQGSNPSRSASSTSAASSASSSSTLCAGIGYRLIGSYINMSDELTNIVF